MLEGVLIQSDNFQVLHMTRNMTRANEVLFHTLHDLLPVDIKNATALGKRWIRTTDAEKDWLQNVVFSYDQMLRFDEHRQFLIATHNSITYLVCIGLTIQSPPEEFQEIPKNAGLFGALVFELKLSPLEKDGLGFSLAENIFVPIQHSSKGTPYNLEDITSYFPDITTYRIHSNSPLLKGQSSLYRIGLFATANCPILQSLKWSQASLNTIQEICTVDTDSFPHELILRALIEKKFEHAYLEIYRSIEFLYPIPKINKLKTVLGLSGTPEDLSEKIENILGWRPTEEGAIQHLFNDFAAPLVEDFRDAFGVNNPDQDFTAVNAASLVYRLRNDCVHFRPINKKSPLLNKVDWEKLLQTMLSATHHCYQIQMVATT